MRKISPLIEVKNLSKTYKIKSNKLFQQPSYLKALNDVSFSVEEGETIGIIGESGCGKSTLGRAMVNLNSPNGEVIFKGENVLTLSGAKLKTVKKDIQMIFQDPYSTLNPKKIIGKLIEEAMAIHNIGDAKYRFDETIKLLKQVGLDESHYSRYPHEFSGGQRQRINIARVLALKPKVIICDEPVSALDVSIQSQVINLLNDLQEEYNLTYIFISHDLGVVKYISKRVAIMYLGKIVELCTTEELYKKALHPYSNMLLSSAPPESPFEEEQKFDVVGEVPSPLNLPKGCAFYSRCKKRMDKCLESIPELREIEEGRYCACHLYEETENE